MLSNEILVQYKPKQPKALALLNELENKGIEVYYNKTNKLYEFFDCKEVNLSLEVFCGYTTDFKKCAKYLIDNF